jgi:hypothetical protein
MGTLHLMDGNSIGKGGIKVPDRWLPYLPPRWRNGAIALAALLIFSRVVEGLANPRDIDPLGFIVLLVFAAVFAYFVVYVAYAVTTILRR